MQRMIGAFMGLDAIDMVRLKGEPPASAPAWAERGWSAVIIHLVPMTTGRCELNWVGIVVTPVP